MGGPYTLKSYRDWTPPGPVTVGDVAAIPPGDPWGWIMVALAAGAFVVAGLGVYLDWWPR